MAQDYGTGKHLGRGVRAQERPFRRLGRRTEGYVRGARLGAVRMMR
ncbi:hypothetical protein ABZ214_33515 [Streptomyces iakyrus]